MHEEKSSGRYPAETKLIARRNYMAKGAALAGNEGFRIFELLVHAKIPADKDMERRSRRFF
jgi:hypothetical protein